MRGADEKEDKRERRGKDRQRKRIKKKKARQREGRINGDEAGGR